MRVIARLDVKGESVVKGIAMEGWRKVGDPGEMAARYADDGADEILFLDVVASLYNRCGLFDIVTKASANCFVPLIVGGGLRTLEDMRQALNCGADSLAINTAAIKRPEFISEAARKYGSQAITVSIEAKKVGDHYEAFTDYGREPTGKEVGAWAKEAEERGAGQLLLTSVDKDGTGDGYDRGLLRRVSVSIPVLISGGYEPVSAASGVTTADGICIGSALHSQATTIFQVKRALMSAGLSVRPPEERAA